jgi:2-deoxy-D-gluconate 3-dehydrogenase
LSADPFSLQSRVAIVTGGNRGIGLGIAAGLVRASATVVISGRNAEQGAVAAAKLGGNASFHTADISDAEACAALVRDTLKQCGRLDILINNAGTNLAARPEAITLADLQTVMATNLTGTLLCAQAAYPAMLAQGGGKIINLGSTAAIFGSATGAAYAASKGAIVQLTKSLAVAWGRDNIQVNAILPGYIDTDMMKDADTARPGFLAATNARTPAGRRGRPQDLAGLAVFLASSASDFVTGTAIPVDGGYSVQI